MCKYILSYCLKLDIIYHRKGQHTACGPHHARESYRNSFELTYLILTLAYETLVKARCGPRMKVFDTLDLVVGHTEFKILFYSGSTSRLRKIRQM